MNAATAGRITVWIILILIAYALVVVLIGKLMAWLGSKYPHVNTTPEEYYGYDAADFDYEEEPQPPRAA